MNIFLKGIHLLSIERKTPVEKKFMDMGMHLVAVTFHLVSVIFCKISKFKMRLELNK